MKKDKRRGVWMLALLLTLQMPALFAATESWILQAYAKARQQEQAGDYAAAVQALLPVVQAWPQGYLANLRLGWLYYRHGDYAASVEAYRLAVQSAPEALEPRLGLMLPLMAQARWPEVESSAYQVLKDDPYNYYGNLRLLMALQAQNKSELACRQAEKMVSRYPADVDFLEQWARALRASGNNAQAEVIEEEIQILAPQRMLSANVRN